MMPRYPAANTTYPTRPRTPFRRIWLRYMPVMPARARAHMSTFNESRTSTFVVLIEVAFNCGCPIWTPMNTTPAATAAAPADRMSEVGVTVMSGLLDPALRGGRQGEAVTCSHDSVTRRPPARDPAPYVCGPLSSV